MAFNTAGAAGGAASGAAVGSMAGPWGTAIGAVAGGLLGGFASGGGGDTNRSQGFSPNSTERSQRINQSTQQLQAGTALTAQDLQNYFLSGQYNPTNVNIPNGGSFGNPYDSLPNGPSLQALQFGLQSEQDLSGRRQDVAQGILGQFGSQYDAANKFAAEQLRYGKAAIGSQGQLYHDAFKQNQANNGLQGNLFGSINDYIQSGGGPSDAQRQQIGSIYDSQRQIGQSNLNQQFGEALRGLQDHATTRGLRFGDTPIQDRGGLLAQEFARNATNLESSIGGNQANALLQTPFAQQGQNLQALGQAQGSNLNVLNAFSTPINQAFTQQGQQFQQGQFGAQYSPSTYSGIPLQNLNAYLSGGSYAQPAPSYAAPTPAAYTASPQTNFANQFASGLGNRAAGGVATGIGNLFSGYAGNGNQTTAQPAPAPANQPLDDYSWT